MLGTQLALVLGLAVKERERIAMIEKLLQEQDDPNSATAREIIEEVTERVLKDLNPENQKPHDPFIKSTAA